MIRFVPCVCLHVLETLKFLNLVACFFMVHERASNIVFIKTVYLGVLGEGIGRGQMPLLVMKTFSLTKLQVGSFEFS